MPACPCSKGRLAAQQTPTNALTVSKYVFVLRPPLPVSVVKPPHQREPKVTSTAVHQTVMRYYTYEHCTVPPCDSSLQLTQHDSSLSLALYSSNDAIHRHHLYAVMWIQLLKVCIKSVAMYRNWGRHCIQAPTDRW
jgi:hypothetical protein